jgi:hypothetical protein
MSRPAWGESLTHPSCSRDEDGIESVAAGDVVLIGLCPVRQSIVAAGINIIALAWVSSRKAHRGDAATEADEARAAATRPGDPVGDRPHLLQPIDHLRASPFTAVAFSHRFITHGVTARKRHRDPPPHPTASAKRHLEMRQRRKREQRGRGNAGSCVIHCGSGAGRFCRRAVLD